MTGSNITKLRQKLKELLDVLEDMALDELLGTEKDTNDNRQTTDTDSKTATEEK